MERGCFIIELEYACVPADMFIDKSVINKYWNR